MVVIIISLILSIGSFTYSNQRRQVEYNDAVLKVSTLIKTARNYAMTSRSVYDSCQPAGQETHVPAEGYGVYVSRSTQTGQARFVLFANTKASTDLEKNQYDEVQGQPCSSDLIEEEYDLNGKAVFPGMFTDISPPGTVFSSKTHNPEYNAVILFKTSLADTTIAANDHPPQFTDLTLPADLYLEFIRPQSGATAPKNYIHINRLAGFPETLTVQ